MLLVQEPHVENHRFILLVRVRKQSGDAQCVKLSEFKDDVYIKKNFFPFLQTHLWHTEVPR